MKRARFNTVLVGFLLVLIALAYQNCGGSDDPAESDATETQSSNSVLSSISFSTGFLSSSIDGSSAFNGSTTSYTLTIPFLSAAISVQVTANTQDSTATLSINGASPVSVSDTQTIDLDIGNFALVVTAEDGTSTTYQISISSATNYVVEDSVFSSETEFADNFGQEFSISGDTMVVAAPLEDTQGDNAGAAYVFQWDGSAWVEQQTLYASDAEAGDYFGHGVSIDGNTIAVGAYRESTDGFWAGAAYIFTLENGTWTEQAKLRASNGDDNFYFGHDIAISGDTVVVSAPLSSTLDDFAGAAYVFTRSGTNWSEHQILTASDGVSGDWFSYASIAIDGDKMVIPSRTDDNGENSGSVYVFTRSGDLWSEQEKLQASDGEEGDLFGFDVDIDGDMIVVGAPLKDSQASGAGAVYVFQLIAINWLEQVILSASDAEENDQFGSSVAISGGALLAGARQEDTQAPDAGSAYLFIGSDASWTEHAILRPSELTESAAFGQSVDMDGEVFGVGASGAQTVPNVRTGTTYIYR